MMINWFILAQREPAGWMEILVILVFVAMSSLGGLGQWIRKRAAQKEEQRKAEQRAATRPLTGAQAMPTPQAARPVARPLPPGSTRAASRPTPRMAQPLPTQTGQGVEASTPPPRPRPPACETRAEIAGVLQPEPEPQRTTPPPPRAEPPRRPAAPAPQCRARPAAIPAPKLGPGARETVRLVQDVEEEPPEAVTAASTLTASGFAHLDRDTLRRAILLKEILGPPRALKPLDD